MTSINMYKITSSKTPYYYIGFTKNKLQVNYNNYISLFKKWKQTRDKNFFNTSFMLLQFEDTKIELMETFIYNNKDELNEKKENYLMKYENETVNNLTNVYRFWSDTDEPKRSPIQKNKYKIIKSLTIP